MKWSWRIGRIAGIDLRVHVTFFLLLAFMGWSGYARAGTLAAALSGIVFTSLVFGVVVLHELGHALTARRFGIGTRDITLSPIGGIAALERAPDDPRAELLIAIAGPAVNIGLALLLALGAALWGTSLLPGGWMDPDAGLVAQLFWVNVSLAAFNLLPAFPMDGGRVLRALLTLRLGAVRATDIAATIGKGFAVLFGLVGLFAKPMLLVIALFVWLAASAEARMTRAKHAFASRSPEQRSFAIVDEHGRVVGMLTRIDHRHAT
jgi:Zn-dependent protease